MSYIFSNISTWLIIELVATSILVALNLVIPMLMAFASYRNIVNFYFSSAALSSSLLNYLYIYYLVQTLRSRVLSENNCRAIYYLQTSCTVVLAYTITAMHANFVLCLLSSSSSTSEGADRHHRTCLRSCGSCLRRFFRRFCFCLVLCVWSLSFTATIPLLYTIDSNEKAPKPVYCPGTTQISYLQEWFDRDRLIQSVIFNLIPLLITLFLSLIALLKLFYDAMKYFYLRVKTSKCSPCRTKSSDHAHERRSLAIPRSISMLSSLGILSNSHLPPVTETSTPTSERTNGSISIQYQSCGHWCSTSFLRFLLVLSCCLLACIYPIAMRFYLVYFSVLVPLIFAVLNYSLGQLTPSTGNTLITTSNFQATSPPPLPSPPPVLPVTGQSANTFDIRPMTVFTSISSTDLSRQKSIPRQTDFVTEQYELQSSLMNNLMHDIDGLDEREEFLRSTSTNSSQSSTFPTQQQQRRPIAGKKKYFSNHLYENYHRNSFLQ